MAVKEILQFVLTKLWPWFKDYVWPLLREHVVEIAKWGFEKVKTELKDWAERRSKTRQEDAMRRAKQADDAARGAATEEERRTQEAIAKVWREVAEQFRIENEDLRAKIDELTARAEFEVAQRTRESDPNLDPKANTPVLVLGSTRTSLPALPSGLASK